MDVHADAGVYGISCIQHSLTRLFGNCHLDANSRFQPLEVTACRHNQDQYDRR